MGIESLLSRLFSVSCILLFGRYLSAVPQHPCAGKLDAMLDSHLFAGNEPSFAIRPSGPTTHGKLSAFQFPVSRGAHVFPSS